MEGAKKDEISSPPMKKIKIENENKRKNKRRTALKKTGLCFHYDKTGGCPFEDCAFAHGKDELKDGGGITIAAQRSLIREQCISRESALFASNSSDIKKDDNAEEQEIVPFTARQGSMVDRYYTRLYAADILGSQYHDQFVNMHSNRLCVVGLAPGHVIFQKKLVINKVSFEVGKNNQNLLHNKVNGKKKKGGKWLEPTSPLCIISCTNGDEYTIRSCIRASLFEVNDRLINSPDLISTLPDTDGYIAIVRPKLHEIFEIQNSLLKHEEYITLRQ